MSETELRAEDAFIALTGHSIREGAAAPINRMRRMRQVWLGRRCMPSSSCGCGN